MGGERGGRRGGDGRGERDGRGEGVGRGERDGRREGWDRGEGEESCKCAVCEGKWEEGRERRKALKDGEKWLAEGE